MITAIIPIHDIKRRGFDRLENSLYSISKAATPPQIIVMDGSRHQADRDIAAKICAHYSARHVPSPQPNYNMPMLFNAGMILSATPFIYCTGVDFLYHPTYFDVLLEGANERTFKISPVRYLARSQNVTFDLIDKWDMPKSQDGNLKAAGVDNWVKWCKRLKADGLQFFHRKWFEVSDGYDEMMYGMGGMDNQMHDRAKIAGLNVEWLKEILVLHQWHESKYAGVEGQAKLKQSEKNWIRRDKTRSISWKNVK